MSADPWKVPKGRFNEGGIGGKQKMTHIIGEFPHENLRLLGIGREDEGGEGEKEDSESKNKTRECWIHES